MQGSSYLCQIGDFFQGKDNFNGNLLVDKNTVHRFNRVNISNEKGVQRLTVPVRKFSGVLKICEVEVFDDATWKRNHFHALQSSYGKTPYFDFFEQELHSIYFQDYRTLWELNSKIYQWLQAVIQQEIKITEKNYSNVFKNYKNHFGVYIEEISGLTLLELLFRWGPAGIWEKFI